MTESLSLIWYVIMKHLDIISFFSFIGKGLFAGLVVLYCTENLRKKRELDTLAKNCLLLTIEIKRHIILLEELSKNIDQTIDEFWCLHSCVWDSSKTNFTLLPIEELKRISLYFGSTQIFNSFISKSTIPEKKIIGITLMMALETQAILSMYWDSKNSDLHRRNYIKLRKQLNNYQK